MSALFWGMLWGPVGLLLSMPLTICLLVLGTHVPHLGFLQVLLGDEPALSPYQQIYRRLIAKAVADASTVALAEIEEKGPEQGLDDGMGRMVVLAEADRAQDRLSAAPGRGHRRRHRRGSRLHRRRRRDVCSRADKSPSDADSRRRPAASGGPRSVRLFRCVGGRGQIDDAAASIIAFALAPVGLRRRKPTPCRQGVRRRQGGIGCDPPDLLRLAAVRRDPPLHLAQAHATRRRWARPVIS